MLRGTRIFARCDDNGLLVTVNEKVEVRYREQDSKPYFAYPSNLTEIPGTSLVPESQFGSKRPSTAVEGASAPPLTSLPPGSSSPAGVSISTGDVSLGPAGVSISPAGLSISPGSSLYPSLGPASMRPSNSITPAVDSCVIYADGACSGNPGPCGIGVVLVSSETDRRELSEFLGDGTNNIAELTAIMRAAEAVRTEKRPVHIYTDSSYAIGVLSKNWKAKANIELIAEVKKALALVKNFHLHHVPGHSGVPLNERADQLARQSVLTKLSSGWQTIS